MKKNIKKIIGLLFKFSGIYLVIRELFCKNKVTIVLYHNPKPEMFKRHIEYLSKYYNFISLDRLVNAIYSKDWLNIPSKSLVSQGYNRQIYKEMPAEKGQCFRIVYTGIFYSRHEPCTFFEAIRDLKDLNLEVVVAGDILPCYIRWVEEKQLSKKIVFLDHQKHRKVVALQKGADVLLSFGWPDGHQVPGKIFEYFGACRPILFIKYDDKDIAAQLVNKHKRGIAVINEKKDIIDTIIQLYNLKKDGQIEQHFDLSILQEYTWQARADKFEKVIKNFAGYNG